MRASDERAVELLHLAAADAAIQIAAFPDYVEVADEIAIEIGDAVEGSASAALRELDAWLSQWSGPDHLDVWTIEALSTHVVWGETRRIARRWLAAEGIVPRAPRLFWLTFVGGSDGR